MSDTDQGRKKFTPEELQLAIAQVAFRLSELSEIVGRRLGPQNALLGITDPYHIGKEAARIRQEMLDLTGSLLGED